jgi:hypothetical protein
MTFKRVLPPDATTSGCQTTVTEAVTGLGWNGTWDRSSAVLDNPVAPLPLSVGGQATTQGVTGSSQLTDTTTTTGPCGNGQPTTCSTSCAISVPPQPGLATTLFKVTAERMVGGVPRWTIHVVAFVGGNGWLEPQGSGSPPFGNGFNEGPNHQQLIGNTSLFAVDVDLPASGKTPKAGQVRAFPVTATGTRADPNVPYVSVSENWSGIVTLRGSW